MSRVIITGVTGQDGSYLLEQAVDRGHDVVGIVRRSSNPNLSRIKDYLTHPKVTIVEGDLTDCLSITSIVRKYKPDYIFNTAAQSHVHTSFEQPIYTLEVDALGVLYILEAVRSEAPNCRILTCSTSELFGSEYDVVDGNKIQTLSTPMIPNSPYAIAKLAAHNLIDLYRKSFDMFAVATICFNHCSPRRGENFVERKITKYVAKLYKARNDGHEIPKLQLGNLDACRDFGHAKDYCSAFWKVIENDKPKDYIICTGRTWSIRAVCEIAFSYISADYQDYVEINPAFYRPCEVPYLRGDNSEIVKDLGWQPQYSFEEIIKEMINSDIATEST